MLSDSFAPRREGDQQCVTDERAERDGHIKLLNLLDEQVWDVDRGLHNATPGVAFPPASVAPTTYAKPIATASNEP